ncbi:MAG: tripartite tricarboxylate transporter substrate-binding protein [Pseudomonadota bacterium]
MRFADQVALITAAAFLSGIIGLASPCAAQSFPDRTVRLVVPQTPGGATDVLARAIGQKLSERWGQPVVIDNRGGAGGVIGTDVVAKAPPDGYMLLVGYAGTQAINQSLYGSLPFDSVKDFQTVATIAVVRSSWSPTRACRPRRWPNSSLWRARSPIASPMARRATARSTICSARC